jgi:tetratricopeptide (TPR) repeat protein
LSPNKSVRLRPGLFGTLHLSGGFPLIVMYKTVVPLICLHLFLPVGFAQGDGSRADSYYHFSLAKMYHLREDFPRAVAEFEKALDAHPASASIRTEMAKTLLQMGEVTRAVQRCTEATELAPDDVEAHYLLGRIYYRTRSQPHMRERALERFERVLEIDPNHLDALHDAAELSLEDQRYERAAELFRRLRGLNPGFIGAYYSEARARLELNDPERAVESLEQGLDVRDDIPEYLLLLADLYRRDGELEEAVRVYRRGLAHGPEPRLNEGLARTLVALGRGEEAIPVLEKVVAMQPQEPQLRLDLARAYRQARNLDRAAEVLGELSEQDPENVQIGFELASVLTLMGDRGRASSKFEALLASSNPIAERHRRVFLTNLALLREQEGRYEEAAEMLRRVLADDPDDLDAKLRLFSIYLETSRRDEALALSAEMIDEYDENPYVLVARGRALAAMDRLDEAAELLRAGIRDSADPELLYLAHSQLYVTREEFETARAVIEDGLADFPESERLRFQLGAIFERQKDYSAAEGEFQQLLNSNPDFADVLNYLGYMLAERGVRLEEALGYIQRAVELDPYNGAYLDSLGWVYFKQDNLEKAEIHLKEAARLQSLDPVILEHLGDLYVRKGKPDEARRYYEKSLRHAEKEEELDRVRRKLEELSAETVSRNDE